MARKRLLRAEIEAALSEEQRAKLASLYQLSHILEQSIIGSDYRASDDFRSAIKLSSYGTWLLTQEKKYEFDVPEARLACLLEVAHLDVLLDLDAIDLDRLAAAITNEMKSGRIRFAMAFGPDLYNRAAELFPEERRFLGAVDTKRLLEGQPMGVFHLGVWLGGPFGLFVHRDVQREVRPSQAVPLQHCHDLTCQSVHRVRLTSDPTAAIIRARSEIRKALDSEGHEPSEFSAVASKALRDPSKSLNPDSLETIPYLLGDALGLRELRDLAVHLLTGSHAEVFRKRVKEAAGLHGSADEITDGLGRAELLQLVFLADDTELAGCLDELTHGADANGGIHVPRHEVRRPVLTQVQSSDYGSRAELSWLGVRSVSTAATAPLKLRRLVDSLYFPSDRNGSDELDWQLRSIPGVSMAARLTEFLRLTAPDHVLQRLVMNTRSHVEEAARQLGLVEPTNTTDEELVSRMLWKLGFDVQEIDHLQNDFWRHSDRLRKAADAASVTTAVGEEEINEISTSYFRALERVLADSLLYCTWALTTDHVQTDKPYRYVETQATRTEVSELLAPGLFARGDISAIDVPIDRWTLQPLCRGFEVLADVLHDMQSREATMVRQEGVLPEFAKHVSIQKFPFSHTIPFLDLTDESRARLGEVLRNATAGLLKSRVGEIRNGLLHYRRANVNLSDLVTALENVESVFKVLETLGLARIVYRRHRTETDRWGRSLHTFVDYNGNERTLLRPTSYAWVTLPPLEAPQYLMTAAQFDELGEYLRFRIGSESAYRALWAGIPKRREESLVSQSQDGAPAQSSNGA